MSDREAKLYSLGCLLLCGQGYHATSIGQGYHATNIVYAPFIPVVEGVDEVFPEEREHTPEEHQRLLHELAVIS